MQLLVAHLQSLTQYGLRSQDPHRATPYHQLLLLIQLIQTLILTLPHTIQRYLLLFNIKLNILHPLTNLMLTFLIMMMSISHQLLLYSVQQQIVVRYHQSHIIFICLTMFISLPTNTHLHQLLRTLQRFIIIAKTSHCLPSSETCQITLIL